MSNFKNCKRLTYEVNLDFICPYDLMKHKNYSEYGILYVWNKEDINDPEGKYEEFKPIRDDRNTYDYKYPSWETITTVNGLNDKNNYISKVLYNNNY